jgi:serine/threonine protein kinase
MILQDKPAEHVTNEYTNMLQIYHPFIIEIKAINNTDPYNLYLFFEYILGKPLRYYIKINQKLSLEYARFYLACLITVLDYLHKKKII